jgi:hypothetical protein
MGLQYLLRDDLSHNILAGMMSGVPGPAGRAALPSAYAGAILKFRCLALGHAVIAIIIIHRLSMIHQPNASGFPL